MSIEHTIAHAPNPIPDDARDRWKWVKYQLGLRDITLADIAARVGVVRQAVSQVAVLPSEPIEREIAAVIGVPAARIWPDRYYADGRRRIGTRRRRREAA